MVKRLFTFGCSFTNYVRPTWADLLHNKYKSDLEVSYNFGIPASGNSCIASRVSEAHNKFNFQSGDLVAICWSSIMREDFYSIEKDQPSWSVSGNVFDQNNNLDLPDIMKTPIRFFMRDIVYIDLVTNMLNKLSADKLYLSMTDIFDINHGAELHSDESLKILRHYSGTVNQLITPSYYSWNKGIWGAGRDPHPTESEHRDYLNKVLPEKHKPLDIPVTELQPTYNLGF